MKYCLSSRCSSKYLSQADEIKVAWRDRESIIDLANEYQSATIILVCEPEADQEIDKIDMWNRGAAGRLICCLRSLDLAPALKRINVQFYYGFPIETFYELTALKEAGVCYVRLGAGLFFDMNHVVRFGIPVRAVPNVAYLSYLPFTSGVPGTWIRPDDVKLYEKNNFVSAIEFEDCDTTKEEALFRIYGLEQGWSGPLNELFTNFEAPARNSALSEINIGEARLNCNQRCMRDGTCHLCYTAMRLCEKSMLEKIRDYLTPQE